MWNLFLVLRFVYNRSSRGFPYFSILNMEKRLYFLPADDPAVGAWKENLELFSAHAEDKFLLKIPSEAVEMQAIYNVQEMFLALQHYPQYIEKFLFGFQFQFMEVDNSSLFYPEKYWKSENKYRTWLFRLAEFMPVFFFIKDHDARLFALMGDWLAEGLTDINPQTGVLRIEGEMVQKLRTRLGNICKVFYFYCHGSGFDAKDAIESVLFEYDFPGIAESVYTRYLDEVAGGIEFKIERRK